MGKGGKAKARWTQDENEVRKVGFERRPLGSFAARRSGSRDEHSGCLGILARSGLDLHLVTTYNLQRMIGELYIPLAISTICPSFNCLIEDQISSLYPLFRGGVDILSEGFVGGQLTPS